VLAGDTLRGLRSRGPMAANRQLSRQTLRDQVLAGDGTRSLGLRSCGPIAVSTSIISRFGLCLGGSSRAVAGTVVGSILSSDVLATPPWRDRTRPISLR
jgi:hypothetical protein